MHQDILAYFTVIPDAREPLLSQLHRLSVESFPKTAIDMRYKLSTYSHEEGWVAIANQKNYLSLYTCGATHLAAFRKCGPEYRTGRGCTKFRQEDEVPEGADIQHAMLHSKEIHA